MAEIPETKRKIYTDEREGKKNREERAGEVTSGRPVPGILSNTPALPFLVFHLIEPATPAQPLTHMWTLEF